MSAAGWKRPSGSVWRSRRSPAASERIESYPTPLSRTVDGRELHFQLRGGRIAYIPLEPLLARFKSDAERKVHKLADTPELTDTVGPEGGFRLRYTLERHDVISRRRPARPAAPGPTSA